MRKAAGEAPLVPTGATRRGSDVVLPTAFVVVARHEYATLDFSLKSTCPRATAPRTADSREEQVTVVRAGMTGDRPGVTKTRVSPFARCAVPVMVGLLGADAVLAVAVAGADSPPGPIATAATE